VVYEAGKVTSVRPVGLTACSNRQAGNMGREETGLLDLPENNERIRQHYETRPAFITQIRLLVQLSGSMGRPTVRYDRVPHSVGELSLHGYNV
jgi:hypothetical protein